MVRFLIEVAEVELARLDAKLFPQRLAVLEVLVWRCRLLHEVLEHHVRSVRRWRHAEERRHELHRLLLVLGGGPVLLLRMHEHALLWISPHAQTLHVASIELLRLRCHHDLWWLTHFKIEQRRLLIKF